MPFHSVVTAETETYTGRVTSYPIETGSDVNDHLLIDSDKFSISGAVVGGMGEVNALKSMFLNRELVTYTGRSYIDNLAIVSLNIDYRPDNAYGAYFKASFQRVRIASAQWVETDAYPMSLQDIGKGAGRNTKNKGEQTTVFGNINDLQYASVFTKPAPSSAPANRGAFSYDGLSASRNQTQ
jgi:hypothetical protein